MNNKKIILKNVRVHNLKSINLTLDKNQLIVFTGVSGSGKSSMAFDTLYVEGQRRYVESLSTFARRQLGELAKPELEHAEGISPTISIEQKSAGRNPRSTVGTMTEIYDYLRVLYARVGVPHCPVSGEVVAPQSRERIIKTVQNFPENSQILVLAPYAKEKKGEFKEDFQELLRKGYMRVRVDGQIVNLNNPVTLDGNVSHNVDVVIDRITHTPDNQSRIAEALTNALSFGNGVCSVMNSETQDETLFSMHAYSPQSGLSYNSLEPYDFSFNSPSGMCPHCSGLGIVNEFDLSEIILPDLSISEDCCIVGSSYQTVKFKNIYDNLAAIYGFSVKTPWKKLSEKAKRIFLYGTDKKWTKMHFVHPVTGTAWIDHIQWRGVLHEAHSRFAEAKSDFYRKRMQKLMKVQLCPICQGQRLKPYPAATLLNGKRISEITAMTIAESQIFFDQLQLSPQEFKIAEELLKEIRHRLGFLMDVGLHYLTLDRTAPTLSGGESQRVRLASQIGSGLVGITYILDEPSIGLHPRDNRKLIKTLHHLRDVGNTVIVVEHDEETIWAADHIVDFGPGAGVNGGTVVVEGSLKELLESKNSFTGAYLSGRLAIPVPKKRRKPKSGFIEIKGAKHHNLKNINVKIPLGVFVAVTGVSGSGKSSLITDILYPALSNFLHNGDHIVGEHKEITGKENIDKVIAIDQSPIGRNPRSNPATYIKLFDEIRDLFCQLPESRARGYKPGRFSFNVKEGTCPQCVGMGMVKINMDFLEDAWIECPLCKGKRFDHDTLSVYYKGKNIYDILEMDVAEALNFFENIPAIHHKLETLQKVGMDYIKLGQSSTTLSGGEAQRIKLAKELVRPSTGKTLYILDEPTTGLHFHDIQNLLKVLQEFVDRGNTVLVIEHNMDVVKTADWIIDLGPEGGAGGGSINASGTPEMVKKLDTPTGKALWETLHHVFQQRAQELLSTQEPTFVTTEPFTTIKVQGAEQNNLKHLDVVIPREKLTVCTGPSGSGKTSLAFETVYAEGQRRYIESLSPYARQFVKQMPKPKVSNVEGLSPAIAIEQKAHAGNPRSTVGTMTEIYDYLRIIFARLGIPHCPETGEVIKAISKDYVVDQILNYPEGEKLFILAPVEIRKNDKFEDLLTKFQRQGFIRVRLNGEYFDLDQDFEKLVSVFDRKRKNAFFLVIDRLKASPNIHHRLSEAVETAAEIGDNRFVVQRESGDILFNLSFAVEKTGKSYPEITPQTFAFNTLEGMCPDCLGLGYQYGADLTLKGEIMNQTITGFLRFFWAEAFSDETFSILNVFLEKENLDPFTPMRYLPQKKLQLFFSGSPENTWYKAPQGFQFQWVGLNQVLARAGKSGVPQLKELIVPLLDERECISCQGSRLNPLARNVTIQQKNIHELCKIPVNQVIPFIEEIHLDPKQEKLLEEVKLQLLNRLKFLSEVGLHYISLERKAPTLSGGEAQRIRLARQLGSGLTGVLYVLDEPTIGLHPRDNARLNEALAKLKALGNTLLMVEHDPLTIETADYILDFGPHGGDKGGHIIAKGTLEQILADENSITGAYLSGRKQIPVPKKRRPINGNAKVKIRKATLHNLKNLSIDIPTKAFICFTGVSGSGKSTLMNQILFPAIQKGILREDRVKLDFGEVSGIGLFDKVLSIDQNPIGLTSRSDVGTYVDVLTRIREFFASLPLARAKGLQPRHFSYNHRKGMCTSCWGMGYRRVEMHFLPPVTVICEECKGLRLNPVSLEVTYAGKNLGQYLETTVEEARQAFQNHPRIVRILDTLIAVGLGYLRLGQEMAALSGGEAQRIKLSRELGKRATGKTLYLLDEPTTGLHSEDILKLLKILHQLTDKGNTVIVIEHNLDVIKNADFVIDLGPDAGEAGGEVVAKGTPEQIALAASSWTGKFLKNLLV